MALFVLAAFLATVDRDLEGVTNMALLEPDTSIGSYEDVRFYRKTWFVVVLALLVAPLILPIVLTGPYYQKARSKQLHQSSASVWRATGAGRFAMTLFALFYAVNTAIVLVPIIADAIEAAGDNDSAQPVTTTAAELPPTTTPVSQESTTVSSTSDSTVTTVEQTTTSEATPATARSGANDTAWTDAGRAVTAQRLVDVRAIVRNMAEAVLGTDQVDLAIVTITGDEVFGDTPITEDAELVSLSVSHERDGGESQVAISTRYRTTLPPSEVVSFLRSAYSERGFLEREVTTKENDGETTTEISFEPIFDDVFQRDSVSIDVFDGDDGVIVRIFRFIIDPELPDPTAPLALATDIFPVPVGYDTTGAEIAIGQTLTERASIYSRLDIAVDGPVIGMDLETLIDDFVEAGGSLWSENRRTEFGIYFDGVEVNAEAYVSAFFGGQNTAVTVTIRD